MQLSPQTIKRLSHDNHLIVPFIQRTVHPKTGLSGGLSCAGYDVHLGDKVILPNGTNVKFTTGLKRNSSKKFVIPARTGVLGSTVERFNLPKNICMYYFNKSTLARRFLNASATLAEPGWFGHLTLELYNQTDSDTVLYSGQPIGQVVFHLLDEESEYPYTGKYQGQDATPIPAKKEK